jgi:hypothetical protein
MRLVGRAGDRMLRHGHARLTQQVLGLILVNLHAGYSRSPRRRKINSRILRVVATKFWSIAPTRDEGQPLMRIILPLLLLLAGSAHAEPLAISGATMGTTYHIKVAARGGTISRGCGCRKVLAEIDRRMSYRPGWK